MCAYFSRCKITNYFSRARAHSRDKCVKIDTLIESVDLKEYKLTHCE